MGKQVVNKQATTKRR